MKKLLFLLLALTLPLSLADCGDRDGIVKQAEGGPHTVTPAPVQEIDGGVTDRSDPDAPKTVASDQLVRFDCRFSTLDLAEPGEVLGNHVYHLWARLENGAVKAGYSVEDTGEEHSFRHSHYLLAWIRDIINEYDLARFNGHSVSVAGLPDEYGAELTAEYASQERIYAADNQDNFLSPESMEALLRLFQDPNPPFPENT